MAVEASLTDALGRLFTSKSPPAKGGFVAAAAASKLCTSTGFELVLELLDAAIPVASMSVNNGDLLPFVDIFALAGKSGSNFTTQL